MKKEINFDEKNQEINLEITIDGTDVAADKSDGAGVLKFSCSNLVMPSDFENFSVKKIIKFVANNFLGELDSFFSDNDKFLFKEFFDAMKNFNFSNPVEKTTKQSLTTDNAGDGNFKKIDATIDSIGFSVSKVFLKTTMKDDKKNVIQKISALSLSISDVNLKPQLHLNLSLHE